MKSISLSVLARASSQAAKLVKLASGIGVIISDSFAR